MANRTVKLMGYASSSTSITMAFNGTEVFNGSVIGDDSYSASSGSTPIELLSFDIDQTVNGNIPSNITVSGGNLTVVGLMVNFDIAPHDEFTQSDGTTTTVVPALTEADASSNYVWILDASRDMNSNITINGVVFDKGVPTTDSEGAWHIGLIESDVMECDWAISTPTIIPHKSIL